MTDTDITTQVDWRSITSISDYLTVTGLRQEDVPVAHEELGDGFTLLTGDDGKGSLLKVPMLLVDWTFQVSPDYKDAEGNPASFVYIRAITRNNTKVAFTDGSTGIYVQLREYTDRMLKDEKPNAYGPMYLVGGLQSSTYDVRDAKGKPTGKRGTTFRLSTNAPI